MNRGLIPCKGCGNPVSKSAKACPSCGAPVKRGIGCGGLIVLLILAGGIVSLVSTGGGGQPSQSAASTPIPSPSAATSSSGTDKAETIRPFVEKEDVHGNWTTTDGKSYYVSRIWRIEPDSVTIVDNLGAEVRINLAMLPSDLQQRFNYDPDKAQAAIDNRKAQAQVQREAQFVNQVKKSQVRVGGRIVQIIASDSAVLLATEGGKMIYVSGVNAGNHVDGDNVSVMAVPNGPTTYTTVLGAQATVESYYVLPKD